MIYVTMKDGRTLRYNTCYFYAVEEKWFSLATAAKDGTHLARISTADVERIEFTKPCAITKNGKHVKVNY